MKYLLKLNVNGKEYERATKPNSTLDEFLRDELGLKGTKIGCGEGECGACTIIMDGQTVNACCVLALEAEGSEITTIEGVASGKELHPIQKSFIEQGAVQCGYCTPGMVLSTKAFLDKNPSPTDREAREALSGNLCRCTGYQKIIDAVLDAAQAMQKGGRNE